MSASESEAVHISQSVEARLSGTNGEFLLRLQKSTALSRDLIFSTEGGDSQAWEIKIADVIPDGGNMRQDMSNNGGLRLGVNGFGRVGKLTVWHHIGRKYFREIVVNIGRESGTSLTDIAHYVERDSSYGI